MRKVFTNELDELNQEMIDMGSLCEEAIAHLESCLIDESKEEAKLVKPVREKILAKEKRIESMCMRLLLLQQPMASDLRCVSSALKMVTDMYRIGEVTGDAAYIITNMNRFHQNLDIGTLAKRARAMVQHSIASFVHMDMEVAKKVVEADDEVDNLFDQVKQELIEKITSNPSEVEEYVDLLMIAKYFEKIGDHAVSIAEWVEYSITGVHQIEE